MAARSPVGIGLTTTNGVEITLAAVPTARLSTVRSADVGAGNAFPATGVVNIGRGPVLQFEYQ